jgi:hypothetical protein
MHLNQEKPVIKEKQTTPYIKTSSNELLDEIYTRLDKAYQNRQLNEECQLVASYFAVDYFTLKDKEENQIGGLDYIYPDLQSAFSSFALKSFYVNKEEYPELEVEDYEIISFSPSKVVIEGLENNEYYNVLISLRYKQKVESLPNSANIVLVLNNDRFYVVGVDNA